MPAKSVAAKQADAVMENQLEIPSFGQKKNNPKSMFKLFSKNPAELIVKKKGLYLFFIRSLS